MDIQLGANTADEILLASGSALSWWEGSEDALMGLFQAICGRAEPIAFETYVASPRNRRSQMLKSALEKYKNKFEDDETEKVLRAMKALEKLARIRNEIAHSSCSRYTHHENEIKTRDGYYLMPSFFEQGWHVRGPRYVHTPNTITDFTAAVRKERGHILDVYEALTWREQMKNGPKFIVSSTPIT